ncbi:MAG: hypothetical protein GC171_02590 [Terrimonas sp.]|nr:hypothetical protein [Terrimonas sp.]
MSSFSDKVYDKLIETSVEKIIALFAIVTGLSVFAIAKATKALLSQKIVLTVSQLLAFTVGLILLVIFIALVRKKLKAKQKFEEGTRVILSTHTYPVMSAGSYNFINNKVHCSWTHEKEVKHQWINQNQLIEYTPPNYTPQPKNRRSIWDY